MIQFFEPYSIYLFYSCAAEMQISQSTLPAVEFSISFCDFDEVVKTGTTTVCINGICFSENSLDPIVVFTTYTYML